MKNLVSIAAVCALSACTPQTDGITGSGINIPEFFTFKTGAVETWEFVNNDPDVTYVLLATLSDVVEQNDDGLIFAVNWAKECRSADPDCFDQDLHTVKWRVDIARGVFVPGFVPAGSPALDFEPDVQIALDEMETGDSVETVTSGYTFKSDYLGFAECPVRMAVDWGDDCTQFSVTDGDKDPETNAGLTGSYWMIPGFDFVGFQSETDTDIWQLAAYECVGEC